MHLRKRIRDGSPSNAKNKKRASPNKRLEKDVDYAVASPTPLKLGVGQPRETCYQMLHELKFYSSAREDIELIECLMEDKVCKPRHVIVLFHDALEFLMYECLQLLDVDIYENGQNTIGFDKALTAIIKSGYRPCYMATIREIQKLRGDAKHHAQDVEWPKVEQIAKRWKVICVCMTWDLISPSATAINLEWAAEQYSLSQYSLYQRCRNKNWQDACRHLLSAVSHKKCDIDQFVERPRGSVTVHLPKELRKLEQLFASGSARQDLLQHIGDIDQAIKTSDWEEACVHLSKVYSALEATNPTQFDVASARFLTPNLALAPASRVGKSGMSWCRWSNSDTKEYNEVSNAIQGFLGNQDHLVDKFGEPFYDHDEDRYWKWWEFVVFDGEEWHSFHLNDCFAISPESFHISEDDSSTRERVAKVALAELQKAAQQDAEPDALTGAG
ncbi:hypothetical protein ACFL3Q_11575 [Planctomycetota bacterium]